MSDPALEARLRVVVGEGEGAFRLEADLFLEEGTLVLFGPSGAGKSLTLQALAGLVAVGEGHVRVRGRSLLETARRLDVASHRRRIGYVPQHHSLLPFCDVEANVAFGLPRRERRRGSARVAALMNELAIAHLARARPESLSGGERQRVALARALAVEPPLLLLDEPFASIDRSGRRALWALLRASLARHATAAVLVTHDAEEAMALATRVVRFERGSTVASGAPGEVLAGAAPLRLSGRTAAPPSAADGARARVRLESAELEGPSEWVAALGPEFRVDATPLEGNGSPE